MPSPEIIRSLIFVLRCLTNNLDHNPPDLLDQVIISGQINYNVLRNVEGLLQQRRKRDAVQIIRKTLEGNYVLLHQWQRHFLEILRHDTEGDSQHRSQVSNLPQPSRPFGEHTPEEPREPRHCCICGTNVQDIQNSYRIWPRLSEMITQLTQSQRQSFIKVIHNYDQDILYPLRLHSFPSSAMVEAYIVWRLQQHHINGNKCILCLLNYAFQRIGCSDLADEIRYIRSRMH